MSAEVRTDAHETIKLKSSSFARGVYFHRYGCMCCRRGVTRVVIDVDGEKNVAVDGEIAQILWEIAEEYKARSAAR